MTTSVLTPSLWLSIDGYPARQNSNHPNEAQWSWICVPHPWYSPDDYYTYPMMKFSWPRGVISAATMSFYVTSPTVDDYYTLHRVTKDWTSNATWLSPDGSTLWTTPGSDYDSTVLANVGPFSPSYSTVTSGLNAAGVNVVKLMALGQLPNFGFVWVWDHGTSVNLGTITNASISITYDNITNENQADFSN